MLSIPRITTLVEKNLMEAWTGATTCTSMCCALSIRSTVQNLLTVWCTKGAPMHTGTFVLRFNPLDDADWRPRAEAGNAR